MADSIKARIEEIKSEPLHTTLNQLQIEAIELILSAVGTPKWEKFVGHFADAQHPEQLKRLKLEDDLSDDTYIRQTVCYLVANCVCGGGTGSRLADNIGGQLDVGLKSNSFADLKNSAGIS